MRTCHTCDRLPKRRRSPYGLDYYLCDHYRPDDDEEPYCTLFFHIDLDTPTDCIEWKPRRPFHCRIVDSVRILMSSETVFFRKCIKYRSFRR